MHTMIPSFLTIHSRKKTMSLSQLIHALQLAQRSVAPESPRVVFTADAKEFDICDTIEIGLSSNKKEVAILLTPEKQRRAFSTNKNIRKPKLY